MSIARGRTFRLLSRRGATLQESCRRSAYCATMRCSSTVVDRHWSTPLAKNLAEAINATGPISIANYMRQCLTSDQGGYYTRQAEQGTDQFGKTGDFVTSPEISQIFGELVGIWFVAEWMAQGKRGNGLQLVELGPGRGTLMDDMLRTIRNFKSMATGIETIYLVESSPSLREKQHALLCGDEPLAEHGIGFSSMSKYLPRAKVVWTEDVNFIPKDNTKTSFIVAHEFFDALPFHAFQSVQASQKDSKANITTTTSLQPHPTPQNEWRELLVTPTAPPSPFASATQPKHHSNAEFELSVSPRPTPYSQLLPTLSPRYKNLLSQTGSTLEISEAARIITGNIAQFIGGFPSDPTSPRTSPAGAALIIDYGPASTVPVNSLRGIRSHKVVSPFESPGEVDLSGDVDFGALVEAALEASEDVEVHGPVEQASWLESMGGRERCEALTRRADGGIGGDVVKRIESGWKRLVDRGPNGMGKLYRALSIVPVAGGKRRPVGFGGELGS